MRRSTSFLVILVACGTGALLTALSRQDAALQLPIWPATTTRATTRLEPSAISPVAEKYNLVFPAEEPEVRLAPELDLDGAGLFWEQGVDAATGENFTEAAQARVLLAMLQSLPEEALETATREAMDRLPDSDYAVAQPLLTDPATHGASMSVLIADLMERPDAITLPTLLAIARRPSHPYAGVARGNLELLLGIDCGTDWPRWDAAVRRALVE